MALLREDVLLAPGTTLEAMLERADRFLSDPVMAPFRGLGPGRSKCQHLLGGRHVF